MVSVCGSTPPTIWTACCHDGTSLSGRAEWLGRRLVQADRTLIKLAKLLLSHPRPANAALTGRTERLAGNRVAPVSGWVTTRKSAIPSSMSVGMSSVKLCSIQVWSCRHWVPPSLG